MCTAFPGCQRGAAGCAFNAAVSRRGRRPDPGIHYGPQARRAPGRRACRRYQLWPASPGRLQHPLVFRLRHQSAQPVFCLRQRVQHRRDRYRICQCAHHRHPRRGRRAHHRLLSGRHAAAGRCGCARAGPARYRSIEGAAGNAVWRKFPGRHGAADLAPAVHGAQ